MKFDIFTCPINSVPAFIFNSVLFKLGLLSTLSSDSTVVKHLTLNPEVEGLNPATGTGREKIKTLTAKVLKSCLVNLGDKRINGA